jgi:oxysterol-binding protein-related protein 8
VRPCGGDDSRVLRIAPRSNRRRSNKGSASKWHVLFPLKSSLKKAASYVRDLLGRCARGGSGLDRLASVVAWSISTTRPPIFGLAPYNPVLGETHHVSAGPLNVLIEQVSHRPPVSALHATHAAGDVELVWCQHPAPRFHGASIEATVRGKRLLRLPKLGETYELGCPSLLIRLLPAPSVEWAGDVRVACRESGLEAELTYCRSRSFLGIGRCVKGRILRSGSGDVVCEIDGHWDRTASVKDVKTGEVSVLYDAERAVANLGTPVVEDQKVPIDFLFF